jgi:hypothetical protein
MPSNLERNISASNPLKIIDGQSWAFWNFSSARKMASRGVEKERGREMRRQGSVASVVSKLSMEREEGV